MPNHSPEHALPLLHRLISISRGELLALLLESRGDVHQLLLRVGRAKTGGQREQALKDIGTAYDLLKRGLGRWITDVISRGVYTTSYLTENDLQGDEEPKSVVEFSRRYAKELLDLLSPGNAEALVGVQTDRMKATDLSFLRGNIIEVMRKASLTGATSAEVQKELTRRMLDASEGGLPGWQFIDKSGRAWKSGNYFNMLTRTVTARVTREAYTARLIGNGFDLVTIEGGGSPCPVCLKWRGLVVSLTGATLGFPTLSEAQRSGVFHPNCVCEPRYIDRTDPRVEQQKGKAPKAGATPAELLAHAEARQEEFRGEVPDQQATEEAAEELISNENKRLKELNQALAAWAKERRR